ncbi:MAG: MFS transporter [Gaiellaceae bacterium]
MRRLRRPAGGLWDNPDFVKLWTGQSISELGSQVSQLAIPLLAVTGLHATALEFSLLGVLGFLPFILFALPAGACVDRLARRPILIAGDATRAALLVLIPILWATHSLRLWHLLVLQFAIGVCTVFFDVAYQSYLPSLVERDQLVEGNSKLQLTVSVTQVAGPSASGVLIAAITAPYAILVDATSFVISTLFLVRMRHREPRHEAAAGAPKPKLWPEVKEGLRWVIGNRWLRAIAICTGTSNFFSNVLFAIFVLYAVRSLHLSATEIGLVFGVGSFGSIFGALVVNRLQQAIGVGRTILLTAIVFSGAGLAFPLAPRSFPLPLLMVGQACFGFGAVAYNITQVSLRQAITPERLQGRMNAAMRWVVWGTIPIGTLTGGAIATAFGLRAALWAGAIGGCFTFLAIVFSSVRSIREMPEPEPAPTPAQAELAGGLIDGHPLPGPAAADA